MPTETTSLNTLESIKRLAKAIKKDAGIKHFAALDQAAMRAGFANYAHAQRTLKDVRPSTTPDALSDANQHRDPQLKLSTETEDSPSLPTVGLMLMVESAAAKSANGVAHVTYSDLAAAIHDSRPMSGQQKLRLRKKFTRAGEEARKQGLKWDCVLTT
ncbi:hypothetical protein FSY45_20140 [Comamonas sp. Z1]|uniref:hypothetical protein n=1 Tax=Comamonas sp. Z1 TaxID=2601246 RepID=UPI0011E6C2AB|nr:hypothetical protein [Comamonas sp. Z1]TYK74149.1 hypothetical protein FSY45_20140 [Comamonas sp. Z1]